MFRNFTCGVFATALFMCSLSALAECVPFNRDDAAMGAKRAEYAMAVISDPNYLASDTHCVESAMWYLGQRHFTDAIPKLIALLGYRSRGPLFTPDVSKQYPAINALSAMGKSAVPALIQVIAAKDNGSVESRNAIFALMSMNEYREKPGEALALLKQAAGRENDAEAASRLYEAVRQAREHWCVVGSCNE
ncbi:MAG: hypothetical protein ACE14M_15835 [Terriglobales bacterium]